MSVALDLRSDTGTKPTAEMRAAMAAAEVGDEQLRQDPTLNELQRRMAQLLDQEAALFLPTATMANQIALKVLTRPGCLLLAEERTHTLIFESGGPAVHSGLVMHGLPSIAGRIAPEHLREVVATSDNVAPASVVCLENTHRMSGGRVWPLAEYERVVDTARELGLAVHLDGARLLNAAVAARTEPAEWAGLADTVTVCFSKGLGCPLGAVLAGSHQRIEQAWREKFLFGGAMRQAGIVAAAALYAIDHHVDRLADDHARARRLAEGLADSGVLVDLDAVESNFVPFNVGAFGLDSSEAQTCIAAEGVLVGWLRPGLLCAATYLGVNDDDVDFAAAAIARALIGTKARTKEGSRT